MKPSEYESRYNDLFVPIFDREGDFLRWTTVTLNKYVLIVRQDDEGKVYWDAGHPQNQQRFDELLGKTRDYFRRPPASLKVVVQPGDRSEDSKVFSSWQTLWYRARKAFLGKACPEEAQITLQLAMRFKLTNEDGLQDYCDKFLGLDCNGFVGNYIVHGWRGADWDSETDSGFLANQGIRTIMEHNGTKVTKLDDVDTLGTYLLGLVDRNSGQIIDRFGSVGVGHLLVTEPGTKTITMYEKKPVPALLGVESTGGVGLIDRNCDLVSVTKDGVFTVKRWSHPEQGPSRFRMYRLTR
jgi:hypothetical protein